MDFSAAVGRAKPVTAINAYLKERRADERAETRFALDVENQKILSAIRGQQLESMKRKNEAEARNVAEGDRNIPIESLTDTLMYPEMREMVRKFGMQQGILSEDGKTFKKRDGTKLINAMTIGPFAESMLQTRINIARTHYENNRTAYDEAMAKGDVKKAAKLKEYSSQLQRNLSIAQVKSDNYLKRKEIAFKEHELLIKEKKAGASDLNIAKFQETRRHNLAMENKPSSSGIVNTSTPGVYFDKSTKKFYENDESGNPRELKSPDVLRRNLEYKESVPTSMTRDMQQSVPSVLQLVGQARNDLNNTLSGPLAGRWKKLWSTKIGASDPNFRKLNVAVGLLKTRLMRMHVGARGGQYIMEHFNEMLDAGKDSPENLKAAFDEIEAYAKEVGTSIIDQKAMPFVPGENKSDNRPPLSSYQLSY